LASIGFAFGHFSHRYVDSKQAVGFASCNMWGEGVGVGWLSYQLGPQAPLVLTSIITSGFDMRYQPEPEAGGSFQIF
jgi:hypothetical protein